MSTPMRTNVLSQALRASRQALVVVGVFSAVVNLLLLTVPLYMLQLFDRVLASYSYDTLIYLTIIAVTALLVMMLVDIARSRVLIRLSGWLQPYLSLEALNRSASDLLQGRQYSKQALHDINYLYQFTSSSGIFTLFDSPWVPIYLAVIFLLHPVLGILATIGALLLFSCVLANEFSTRGLRQKANASNQHIQQQLASTLQNAEVIQAMGMMPSISAQWAGNNSEMLQYNDSANRLSGTWLSISKFFRMTLQLLMLGTGAYLVVGNEITPGVMIAGSILLARALAPVEQSIGVWKQLLQVRSAYHRLQQHFAQASIAVADIQLPTPTGELHLDGCSYTPTHSETPIIKNISLRIKPGQLIALIGPSAAGKTTLARLMVGIYPCSKGCVRLDGANIFTWNRQDLGQHIGYLPQDIELFSGSIKANIARMAEVDDAAVITAAKMAGLHTMILQFPKGYDTPVTATLSAGQKQRLALARALYQQPCLLVLDEPNANLDTQGEQALEQTLLTMHKKGATIIIITHRMALLQQVDTIVMINAGQIQVAGPRDKVLEHLRQTTMAQQGKPSA